MRQGIVNRCLVAITLGAAMTVSADVGDQLDRLLANDGAPDKLYGFAVAAAGKFAVIGAPHLGDEPGAAYLYNASTGWPMRVFEPPDGGSGDRFGFAVAMTEDLVLIGAPYHQADDTGSAYLFDRATGALVHTLTPRDAGAGMRFGYAVAMTEDKAIVGAAGPEVLLSGAAFVFDLQTGEQLHALQPDDGLPNDKYGRAVAINESHAIVGAEEDGERGISAGAAYLFDLETGDQLAKLLPEEIDPGDHVGASVGLTNSSALIGAFGDDDNGSNAGAAYWFSLSDYEEIDKVLPGDGGSGDDFGIAIAISANGTLIGARSGGNGAFSGAAYLFRNGNQHRLTPIGGNEADFFGIAVGLGHNAIVGAAGTDDHGVNAGAAYVFDAGAGCAADVNNDGVVDVLDFIEYQVLWQSQSDAADCDANGQFNVIDFVCFQLRFEDGCP